MGDESLPATMTHGRTVLCLKDPTKDNAVEDYRKAYEFVPHNSINECMKLIGIADNVRNFLEKSMKQWKLSLTSNGEGLGEVGVNRETVFHHYCLF